MIAAAPTDDPSGRAPALRAEQDRGVSRPWIVLPHGGVQPLDDGLRAVEGESSAARVLAEVARRLRG